MKVLFITRVPFPEGMAPTRRLTCYAKGLSMAGVASEIIIVNRTEGNNSKANSQTFGRIDNLADFKYMGSTTKRSPNLFIRKWYDLIDLFRALKYAFSQSDCQTIIYNYGDDIILHLLFSVVCVFKRAKQCRELCEYPYQTVEHVSSYRKLKSWISLHCLFKIFDGIVPISQTLYDLADCYKREKALLLKVPIIVEKEERTIKPIEACFPFIFHSGKLDEQKDGFIGMLNAFCLAHKKHSDLHFYSTGRIENSSHSNMIMQIIKEYNVESFVHFLGYISNDMLFSYQKASSCFIINKNDTFQNKYCFPTKLGEYLLTGNVVITTDIGESNYFLVDHLNSLIVPNGDVQAMADAIMYVLDHPDESKQIGQNGKKLSLSSFSPDQQGKRMALFFNQIVNNDKNQK